MKKLGLMATTEGPRKGKVHVAAAAVVRQRKRAAPAGEGEGGEEDEVLNEAETSCKKKAKKIAYGAVGGCVVVLLGGCCNINFTFLRFIIHWFPTLSPYSFFIVVGARDVAAATRSLWLSEVNDLSPLPTTCQSA